jgi:pimeloyl-ACP methyl ester carboxylesterase
VEYYRKKFNTLSLVSPRKAAEKAFELFCTPYTRKRNFPVPEIFKKAEQLTINLENIAVKGFRWKPDHNANGKKILICHGFDGFSYRFDKYVPSLLAKGFEVLAFDAPAHGVSSGTTITIIQYRDMILEINNQYGTLDGIMAHSFGGLAVALALEALKDYHCKRLVLIAPATETTHAVEGFLRYLKLNEKVTTAFNQLIEELGGVPASWYSVARVLQKINVPTLWLHDVEDSITPYEHMHHLTEKGLPHIQFEITKGLGHSLYTHDNIHQKIIAYFTELVDL